MEIMEFTQHLVWVTVLPFIGWAVADVVNVPAYVRMCRETIREYKQREMEAGIQASIDLIKRDPEIFQISKNIENAIKSRT